ncbi:MAG: hypothetical protein SFW67_35910 [Myxococcaceae bacterium]|nr:hypothetical protein [Myxococcaceae bacterium]
MAKKILSKTDLSRNAIVLNEELARVFHQRGVFPSLGGDNLFVVAVKIYFKNTGEELLASYYASLRNEDRPIEERMWANAFGKAAVAGDELTIEFDGKRFVAEVRPAP